MSFCIRDTHKFLKKYTQDEKDGEKKSSSTVSTVSEAHKKFGSQSSGMKIKTSEPNGESDYF